VLLIEICIDINQWHRHNRTFLMRKGFEMFKCNLVNMDALSQRCGFGEGKTWNEAQANALALALQRDPNAKIDGNSVSYSGGYSL
jgi:hypothetical protein